MTPKILEVKIWYLMESLRTMLAMMCSTFQLLWFHLGVLKDFTYLMSTQLSLVRGIIFVVDITLIAPFSSGIKPSSSTSNYEWSAKLAGSAYAEMIGAHVTVEIEADSTVYFFFLSY